MDIRKKVQIRGLKGTWTTNLTDEDLLEFLELHSQKDLADQVRAEVSGMSLGIKISMDMLPFRDGTCLWGRVNDDNTVLFRTQFEWELWNARDREVKELREEQALERDVEDQLFQTEDRHLHQSGDEALGRSDFDAANRCYCARAELRRRFTPMGFGFNLDVMELLDRFSMFPTSRFGLAFLTEYYAINSGYFEWFAHKFWSLSELSSESKTKELEAIYGAAVQLFPSKGYVYKQAALFWKREGRLDLAIKYCQLALEKGFTDGTKSGFRGRLERLTKERLQ